MPKLEDFVRNTLNLLKVCLIILYGSSNETP